MVQCLFIKFYYKVFIMATRIFISATNTDVGKTYATLLLLQEYTSRGFKVGVFKPIETGVKKTPPDGKKLFDLAKKNNPKLNKLSLEEIVPYRFTLPASPFIAKQEQEIDLALLNSSLEKIENYCDIVLIEGAGGLMVPITKNFFMIDLIIEFKASVLLVCPSKLGSINDTLLSRHMLESKKLSYVWAINLYKEIDDFKKITAPFYEKNFLTLQNDIKEIANKL